LNIAIVYYNIYFKSQIVSENNTQIFTPTHFIVIVNLEKRLNNVKIERLGFLKATYLYQRRTVMNSEW